jgi:AraC-like DNA-binding protein
VRTPELVQDGNGDFRFITRVEGGHYQVISNRVDETIDGGEATLLSNGAAGKIRLLQPCRGVSMRIRRDRLAAAMCGFDDRPIRRTALASLPLRLLNGYMDILRAQGPTSDPVLAHQVAGHLIDLVALALAPAEETRARAATGAIRVARLATIRADILANVAEVGLSAKTVGRRHGVSDRYVHMLFEETGQTFSRFVEEQRLKRAHALLSNPAHDVKRSSVNYSEVIDRQ